MTLEFLGCLGKPAACCCLLAALLGVTAVLTLVRRKGVGRGCPTILCGQTPESMLRHRGAVGAGVEVVDILMSKDFPGQNRGFAFVEFYNHACALAAKNALSAPGYT